jgi:type IV secretion system protein VirB8
MSEEEYFARARDWASDRFLRIERASRRAWIAAAIAATVAVLEGIALILLVPLKTVEPVTLLVDRHTGYVQAVRPLDPQKLEASEALTRSFLAQYVSAREGFDRATARPDYRKVALWSAGPARSTYLAKMSPDSFENPFKRYPPGVVVATAVKSISKLSPDTALVRFDTSVLSGGQVRQARPWIAIIRYRYTGAPMRFEDRLVNPLGFQVLSYRRDAEAAADVFGNPAGVLAQ